jgi:hypothetical protein
MDSILVVWYAVTIAVVAAATAVTSAADVVAAVDVVRHDPMVVLMTLDYDRNYLSCCYRYDIRSEIANEVISLKKIGPIRIDDYFRSKLDPNGNEDGLW